MTQIKFLDEAKFDQVTRGLNIFVVRQIKEILIEYFDGIKGMMTDHTFDVKTMVELVSKNIPMLSRETPFTDQMFDILYVDLRIHNKVFNVAGSFATKSDRTKVLQIIVHVPLSAFLQSMVVYVQTGKFNGMELSKINNHISSLIYHELVHGDQQKEGPDKAHYEGEYEQIKMLSDINLEDDSPLKHLEFELLGLKKLNNYFLSDHEKEAYVAQYYKLARRDRIPFSEVAVVAAQNKIDKYVAHYIKRYNFNKNRKTMAIAQVCVKEVYRIFINFFTAMIEMAKRIFPNQSHRRPDGSIVQKGVQINPQDVKAFYDKNNSIFMANK